MQYRSTMTFVTPPLVEHRISLLSVRRWLLRTSEETTTVTRMAPRILTSEVGDGPGNDTSDSPLAASNTSATSSSSSAFDLHNDDSVMIAWYCFIGVSALVVCSLGAVLLWRWYVRRVREPTVRARQEEQTTARDEALARMQANINKFTAQENVQRTRNLCALLQPQSLVLKANDPRVVVRTADLSCELTDVEEGESSRDMQANNLVVEKDGNDSPATMLHCAEEEGEDSVHCCFICLEDFHEGEVICQSQGCRHCFHQECIVSWLINHRSDCPACRQEFLPTTLGGTAAVDEDPTNVVDDDANEYEV